MTVAPRNECLRKLVRNWNYKMRKLDWMTKRKTLPGNTSGVYIHEFIQGQYFTVYLQWRRTLSLFLLFAQNFTWHQEYLNVLPSMTSQPTFPGRIYRWHYLNAFIISNLTTLNISWRGGKCHLHFIRYHIYHRRVNVPSITIPTEWHSAFNEWETSNINLHILDYSNLNTMNYKHKI